MRKKSLLRNRVLAWVSAAAMAVSAVPASLVSAQAAGTDSAKAAATSPAAAEEADAAENDSGEDLAGSTVHDHDANAEAYNLATNTADGTILHAWCWSFNTIKNNMADIAAAGFSTVQTSPANACVSKYPTMKLMGSDDSGGTDGCWWWQYQPTDWTIGNYQLGTEDDFKAMCAEADKYGIKIIVDVIPNHTTPSLELVSQNLFNAVPGGNNSSNGNSQGLYHKNGFNSITNWSDRKECTTGMMGGLPDVNTENPDFQDYFISYLNELVADGCDGMRYDTGKHIGVPSDPQDDYTSANGWTNNFWPVVSGQQANLNGTKFDATDLFIYGEVLQSDMSSSTMAEYQKYIGMTASSYGGTLRSAIRSSNFSASTLQNLNVSDTSKATTWVESHDTYCNDHESGWMTDEQIQLAWAVIACRGEGTPLFFSRPDGSNGSSGNYWGNNVLGAKGDNNFKSTIVTQANFFRNAMIGESTTLSNPTGSNTLLEIARGTSGVALINVGSGSASINISTDLPDGTYEDPAGNGTFKVENKKLTGTVKARNVAFIYNGGGCSLNAKTSTGSTKFSTATKEITLTVRKGSNAKYTTSEGASGSFTSGDTITIGASSSVGDTITVTLSATADKDGATKTQEFTFYKVSPNIAWIQVPSGWSHQIYCYVYNTAGASNAAWPGKAMTKYSDGLYYYEIADSIQDPVVIYIDTDGTTVYNRSTPDMADGISISGSQIWYGSSSDLTAHDYSPANPTAAPTSGPTPTKNPNATATPTPKAATATPKPTTAPSPIDGSYDVYYVNTSKWNGTIYCYAYYNEGATKNAGWPGDAMTKVGTLSGSDVWAYNLPSSLSGLSDVKIIFNNNSTQYPGANQTGLAWNKGECKVLSSLSSSGWTTYVAPTATPTEAAVPKVEASVATGTTFDTESITVTLSLKNATKGTYVLDGGSKKTFTSDTKVVVGTGRLADRDVTLETTATDGKTTKTYTFTYHKKFNAAKNGGSKAWTKTSSSSAAAENDAESVEESTVTLDETVEASSEAESVSGEAESSAASIPAATESTAEATTSPQVSSAAETADADAADTESTEDVAGASATYYTTNATGYGSEKTITAPTDFTAADIIAQGAANDDPSAILGPHEGPVYDDYALYAAYDSNNIYIGWQYVNVRDVSAPEQGYPNSDNGFPDNGDIPQGLAFYIPGQTQMTTTEIAGKHIWGLAIDYTTPITALAYFSSKNTSGTPALFTADSTGTPNYDDNCVAFKDNGITYESYRGVNLSTNVYGINGNGYTGLTKEAILDGTGTYIDFNANGHDTAKDTFYIMTIPYSALGITEAELKKNGMGVMHISTFGASGIGSVPFDETMLDNSDVPYSEDASTSGEKEDTDDVTAPLASIVKTPSGQVTPKPVTATPTPKSATPTSTQSGTTSGTMTVNFGADASSPQVANVKRTLRAVAAGGQGTYTYTFYVNGKQVQSGSKATYSWTPGSGSYTLKATVKDGNATAVSVEKSYVIEGTSGATATPTPTPKTVTFDDVKDTSSFLYKAVTWAAGQNIVLGYSNGYFYPNQNCTRGQVVAFLWRLAGRPEPKTTTNPFKDVKSSNAFYKAILWGSENKIVLGYGSGSNKTFKPNATCTRGEIMAFLWRYAGRPTVKSSKTFSDVPTTNAYYKAIMWAASKGITTGYSDGKFKPDATCTRGQIVQFLYRYSKL